jgi:hypothetical protein
VRLAVVVSVALAVTAGAQERQHPYTEVRSDVVVARGNALEAGAALEIPLDYYVRLGLGASGGVARRDGATLGVARADVIARFLLDPFREVPWGLSLGGGLSVPVVAGDRAKPYLAIVMDVEGPRRHGISPAVQLGLGGGARLGIALRRSPATRR